MDFWHLFLVFTNVRYLSFAVEDEGSTDTNDCAIRAIKATANTAISPLVSFLSFIYGSLYYLLFMMFPGFCNPFIAYSLSGIFIQSSASCLPSPR